MCTPIFLNIPQLNVVHIFVFVISLHHCITVRRLPTPKVLRLVVVTDRISSNSANCLREKWP